MTNPTEQYRLRMECYRSGQMSDKQLAEHLTDAEFAAWWSAQVAPAPVPTEGSPMDGILLIPKEMTDEEWGEVAYNVNRKADPDIPLWRIQEAVKSAAFIAGRRAKAALAAPAPDAVAWTWRDKNDCEYIDMDEAHARDLAASLGATVIPLHAAPPSAPEAVKDDRIIDLEADNAELRERLAQIDCAGFTHSIQSQADLVEYMKALASDALKPRRTLNAEGK